MKNFDVVIVGFGPVGATLANLLGGTALSVAIIDKAPNIYDKPRAIGIDHESLRTLQFCGLGDALRSLISPFKGGVYLGVDGRPIRHLIPASPPYPLGWPPNASFVQPELELLLRRSAERHPNITVALSTELVGIEDGAGRFKLSVRSPDSEEEYSAKYLLGCDGANSFVRRHFGTSFEDLKFDEWWVVVDAWVKDLDLVPETSHQYCFPARPGTYVVGPRNLRRWEFKVLPGESPDHFSTHEAVIKALGRYVDTSAIEIWRIAPYRFHALVAETWQFGNAFLVGDAAHQTPPFLGQGMNSGIRDASNLAWKLSLVERFGADQSLLETYQEERKPHFRALVHEAKELGLIIGELDFAKAKERDASLRELGARGKLKTSRQSFVPNLVGGFLHLADGTLRQPAGMLFPQPTVRASSQEQGLLDDFVGACFLLVLADIAQVDWISELDRNRLRRLDAKIILINSSNEVRDPTVPDWLSAFVEADRVFAEWSRQVGASTYVVRPDRYVYGGAVCPSALKQIIQELHSFAFKPRTR